MALHTADRESPWTILYRQLRFPHWGGGVKVVELDEVKEFRDRAGVSNGRLRHEESLGRRRATGRLGVVVTACIALVRHPLA
jgi:hypothetical protein